MPVVIGSRINVRIIRKMFPNSFPVCCFLGLNFCYKNDMRAEKITLWKYPVWPSWISTGPGYVESSMSSQSGTTWGTISKPVSWYHPLALVQWFQFLLKKIFTRSKDHVIKFKYRLIKKIIPSGLPWLIELIRTVAATRVHPAPTIA